MASGCQGTGSFRERVCGIHALCTYHSPTCNSHVYINIKMRFHFDCCWTWLQGDLCDISLSVATSPTVSSTRSPKACGGVVIPSCKAYILQHQHPQQGGSGPPQGLRKGQISSISSISDSSVRPVKELFLLGDSNAVHARTHTHMNAYLRGRVNTVLDEQSDFVSSSSRQPRQR